MNIILGTSEQINQLEQRYVILELDTFLLPGSDQPVVSWCILDDMTPAELAQTDMYRDLHQNLMKNYRARDWNFCEQAIEHLKTQWHGQLDSFYKELLERISVFKHQEPGSGWTGAIIK